jgi:hypothetical protein
MASRGTSGVDGVETDFTLPIYIWDNAPVLKDDDRFSACFLIIPVACSQLRSRSSSPWGAWLFFFCFFK